MRHFLPARAIAALPRGVREPAAAAGLIAARGFALRVVPGLTRAIGAAVDLAAIAPAAKQHLGATTRAHEQAGSALQTALLGSRRRALDECVPAVKYCPGTRAQRRVGAASVTTARLKGRLPRSFSTAAPFLPRVRPPRHLPHRFTSHRHLPMSHSSARRRLRDKDHDGQSAGGSAPRTPRKAAKKNPTDETPDPASPPNIRGF